MQGSDREMVIKKVELLLSEKMAMLAMLRTGIAVFTLPFSVLTVLIATSDFYEFSKVGALLAVVYILCGILAAVGGYLVFKSMRNIHMLDRKIDEIKGNHKFMNGLIVE